MTLENALLGCETRKLPPHATRALGLIAKDGFKGFETTSAPDPPCDSTTAWAISP